MKGCSPCLSFWFFTFSFNFTVNVETRRNKQIFCFPTFLWVDVYLQLKTTERESEEKTESWMRGQQTCPLTIHFNMWTVSSDVTKAPLAAALSPFMSLLYPPNPWCEWCDVWRLTTTPGSTSPTLFEQWCGFFYVPQEPDKCKCCETGPTVFRPYRKSETIWRVFVYMRK